MSKDLAERLEAHAQKAEFRKRVNWYCLELSMGSASRLERSAKICPDALLVAALEEDNARSIAMITRHYEGESLSLLVKKVFSSSDLYAWIELAIARPEFAEEIQEKLLEKARNKDRWVGPHFLRNFLQAVPNTNPVPVQDWFASNKHIRELVDMTVVMPNKVSVFATVALLLEYVSPGDGSGVVEAYVEEHLFRLCSKIPQAVPMVQAYLPRVFHCLRLIVAACNKVPGIDVNEIEEYAIINWPPGMQREFVQARRMQGPLHDFLDVRHVMES